jgi:ribosome biogenesis protein BMS1
MSDIVFLRAWVPVKPKIYCNPVTSLLLSDKTSWQGMRLTGQIRRDEGLPVAYNADSEYRPIERKARRFNPLQIPKSLQAALPFASKPKILSKQSKPGLDQRRAVALDSQERKVYSLMQQLNTIRKEKEQKRKAKSQASRSEYLKKKSKEEAVTQDKRKERAKEAYAKQGRKNQVKE